MKTLNFLTILATISFAASSVLAADSVSISGVLVYKHQQTIADFNAEPGTTSLGQFFRDSPSPAPGRVTMAPTKQVAILKVRKDDGEKIEIQQDWDDSKSLAVGDKVVVEQIEGKKRVVGVESVTN